VSDDPTLRVLPEVAAALASGAPVVALESSVLAQGLPIPHNRDAAERMTHAVTAGDATPAITAVVRGVPTIGITDEELERFLAREGVRKVSARDLPIAIVQEADGATTVAASLALATLAGVHVFATGGIGGVHREPAFDESADLAELARSPIVVVCAGAKSILDLRATLERLETLGIPVIGYGTSELPGFFSIDTGLRTSGRADSAGEIARVFLAHRALGRRAAVVVAQPPPKEHALPRARVERAVERALADARERGIRGAEMTPALLAAVERETNGASLAANLALLERNAALAAEIAVAIAHECDRNPTARSLLHAGIELGAVRMVQ
jgi:pseudouridine-5'-phosphate glycosidase